MTNDEETKYYTCTSSRKSKKILNIFKVESPHTAYYWDSRSKKWERSSSIGEIRDLNQAIMITKKSPKSRPGRSSKN